MAPPVAVIAGPGIMSTALSLSGLAVMKQAGVKSSQNDLALVQPVLMNDSAYETVPTLISLWSAMLGGSIGAVSGKLTSDVLCNGTIGFFVGTVASVLLHVILFIPVSMLATYITRADIGDHTIGGYKSDVLAGALGGTGGLCAAIIVTLALPTDSLRDPHAFAVCWSAGAFIPLVLVLALVWLARSS